ncbi:two-component sensor histidine kinase [Mycolicibacterium litorale]|nr:two-component sensor histidine kinase [Mycolicibacterium litorale]
MTMACPAAGETGEAAMKARQLLPSAARTRIMGWVLLLILAALGIVTLVTWRLLLSAVDHRMDAALHAEVAEFEELTLSGVNRTTGQPFASVEDMISDAIVYRVARPNEFFLGYVDGKFYDQCECIVAAEQIHAHDQTAAALAADHAFTTLVGSVTEPTSGSYHQPGLGDVRYQAMPVHLAGDPSTGVIVAAFLADPERADANAVAQLMLAVGAGTLLIATAAAWLVAGRILRPLRDVAETARSITDTDLSRRIPTRTDTTGDDLDDLVRTVNSMLDRVEAGVAAQRRFVDDAGHELRTPITIVRGHLELLDPHDPDDIRDTLALVDDELERMNRMVSDLLLLARAEQPTFLQTRPVDVGALTREIFDKVTGLGERDFHLDAVAEITLELDPQRITQALIALADNARRYTAAGDRIRVGSAVVDGWLRFTVADNGPGVSAEDQSRIFDRFTRGSAGGHRSDGAGLGLSIVAAIASAHGGRVELDSSPGGGAAFGVVLPIRQGEQWPES